MDKNKHKQISLSLDTATEKFKGLISKIAKYHNVNIAFEINWSFEAEKEFPNDETTD